MTLNTAGLKPGLYIMRDGAIKSVTDDRLWTSVAPTTGEVEELAASVSWVFSALKRRAEMLRQIPYRWQLRGQDVDEVPFEPDYADRTATTYDLAARLDMTLQTHGFGCLNKVTTGRDGGGRFIGFQWLDPLTMTPDTQSIDTFGYTHYWRRNGSIQQRIPREQLLIVRLSGMRELSPDTPAGVATKFAAQILYGADATLADLYSKNLIPPVIISVPNQTTPEDRKEIRRLWERVLNFRSKSFDTRVIPVNQGPGGERTIIEPLILTPEAAQIGAVSDARIDAIGAAHGIPKSIFRGDAANFAERAEALREFLTVMAGRFEQIARAINLCPEVERAGYELVIRADMHPMMKPDNSAQAQTYAILVQSGMAPRAAAQVAGLDLDLIEEGGEAAFVDEMPQPAPTLAAEEGEQLKRWLKARRGKSVDLARFQSHHLSDRDKRLIFLEWQAGEGGNADDAPFRADHDHESALPYP